MRAQKKVRSPFYSHDQSALNTKADMNVYLGLFLSWFYVADHRAVEEPDDERGDFDGELPAPWKETQLLQEHCVQSSYYQKRCWLHAQGNGETGQKSVMEKELNPPKLWLSSPCKQMILLLLKSIWGKIKDVWADNSLEDI